MKSIDLGRTLQVVLYFTDEYLAPFYRLFCKLANLGDVDLKFSRSIFDINIEILWNFVKLWHSKLGSDFGLYFTDQIVYAESLGISFVGPEISGQCIRLHPADAING